MAITSCEEIHVGRQGEAVAGRKGYRRSTRVFRVLSNSPYDSDFEVLAASGIPADGAVHPKYSYLWVAKRRAVQHDKSKLIWLATIDYSSERELASNPILDPADIEWDTDTKQVPYYFDVNGDAILNSAGQYYADGLKDDYSNWTATVTKNLAAVPAWLTTYKDAVNSDYVYLDGLLFAPKQLKIKKIKISKWQRREIFKYRTLQLTLKIDEDWTRAILDQGLTCVDPNDATKRIVCTTNDGLVATRSMLLDGSGGVLADPSPATAVYREHVIFPLKPFSILPLS